MTCLPVICIGNWNHNKTNGSPIFFQNYETQIATMACSYNALIVQVLTVGDAATTFWLCTFQAGPSRRAASQYMLHCLSFWQAVAGSKNITSNIIETITRKCVFRCPISNTPCIIFSSFMPSTSCVLWSASYPETSRAFHSFISETRRPRSVKHAFFYPKLYRESLFTSQIPVHVLVDDKTWSCGCVFVWG